MGAERFQALYTGFRVFSFGLVLFQGMSTGDQR